MDRTKASTKRYEDSRYGRWGFPGHPAQRDIRYIGVNSSLGLRYNVNNLFHIDLTTQVGLVKTKGVYRVFEDNYVNPTVFDYDENAIVPVFTLAEMSVGINF